MSIESKLAAQANTTMKQSNKDKLERQRYNRIKTQVLSNQGRMSQDSGLISKVSDHDHHRTKESKNWFVFLRKILGIVIVYVTYFGINIILQLSFTSTLETFNESIQEWGGYSSGGGVPRKSDHRVPFYSAERLRVGQRQSLLILYQHILQPTVFTYDQVQTEYSAFFSAFDQVRVEICQNIIVELTISSWSMVKHHCMPTPSTSRYCLEIYAQWTLWVRLIVPHLTVGPALKV